MRRSGRKFEHLMDDGDADVPVSAFQKEKREREELKMNVSGERTSSILRRGDAAFSSMR